MRSACALALAVVISALAAPIADAGPFCDAAVPNVFCDDVEPEKPGYTKAGNGLGPWPGALGGTAFNPNDWHVSETGCDNDPAWYVGVSEAGVDAGYASPHPFGILAGLGHYWVSNTLVTPPIDATGKTLINFEYKVRGSSEPTWDTLTVYAQSVVPPGPPVALAIHTGPGKEAMTCFPMSMSAAAFSGTIFQLRFVFRFDSNTDSFYSNPCFPSMCPTATSICISVMCRGGMGWYVEDILIPFVPVSPVADFEWVPDVGCGGNPYQFVDLTVPGTGAIESWVWDFGDTSPESWDQDPTHQFQEDGTYSVTLTVVDEWGMGDTVTKDVDAVGLWDCPLYPEFSEAEPFVAAPLQDGVNEDVAMADQDGDGLADRDDLCALSDAEEGSDADGDLLGDACDEDDDNDGALDLFDSCPAHPDAGLDTDLDGQGDACDEDDDGDAVPDLKSGKPVDNCPYAVNSAQGDLDADGEGDACDGDADGDGVPDLLSPLAGGVEGASLASSSPRGREARDPLAPASAAGSRPPWLWAGIGFLGAVGLVLAAIVVLGRRQA